MTFFTDAETLTLKPYSHTDIYNFLYAETLTTETKTRNLTQPETQPDTEHLTL